MVLCPQCSDYFTTKKSLNYHIGRIHKRNMNKQRASLLLQKPDKHTVHNYTTKIHVPNNPNSNEDNLLYDSETGQLLNIGLSIEENPGTVAKSKLYIHPSVSEVISNTTRTKQREEFDLTMIKLGLDGEDYSMDSEYSDNVRNREIYAGMPFIQYLRVIEEISQQDNLETDPIPRFFGKSENSHHVVSTSNNGIYISELFKHRSYRGGYNLSMLSKLNEGDLDSILLIDDCIYWHYILGDFLEHSYKDFGAKFVNALQFAYITQKNKNIDLEGFESYVNDDITICDTETLLPLTFFEPELKNNSGEMSVLN